MTGPVPKDGLAAIRSYVPGKARLDGATRIFKLSANENALGTSPLARAAYQAAQADLSLYPDMRASALRAGLAARFGVEPERLIFGAGSDELFALACQAFLAPGENAVQPQFGFAAWIIAVQAAGGEMRVAAERNHCVDVDALLSTIDDRTKIVFLANPGNPTGTAIPFAEVRRFHAALPSRVLLILDSAYVEFAGKAPDFDAGTELARTAPNVLMTRTFSKLYGLAALRIGWGYGAQSIIEAMDRVRSPFNTTAPAQAAALAALGDDDFIERSIAYVEEGRERLAGFFQVRGVALLRSYANFVTAFFPAAGDRSAAAIERALAERGILVRTLGNYGLPDALRITIGPPPAMDALYASLGDILSR